MSGPDFLIAGGHKCATTSLHAILDRHQDVAMSEPKEPHFLCRDGVADRLPNVVTDPTDYQRLWPHGSGLVRGESSVLYLPFADEVTRRMASELDHPPKVVISIRNPIERALSSYLDVRLKNPAETAATFDEAVDRELRRDPWSIDGEGSPTLRHLALGAYSGGIETFMRALGTSNVHVVLFDDVRGDPDGVATGILEFLGVEDAGGDALDPGRRLNEGGRVWRSHRVARVMRHPTTVAARRALARKAPTLHSRLATVSMRGLGTRAPEMSRDTRDRLVQLYRPEVDRLERLIRRPLGHWLEHT